MVLPGVRNLSFFCLVVSLFLASIFTVYSWSKISAGISAFPSTFQPAEDDWKKARSSPWRTLSNSCTSSYIPVTRTWSYSHLELQGKLVGTTLLLSTHMPTDNQGLLEKLVIEDNEEYLTHHLNRSVFLNLMNLSFIHSKDVSLSAYHVPGTVLRLEINMVPVLLEF